MYPYVNSMVEERRSDTDNKEVRQGGKGEVTLTMEIDK